MRRGKEVAQGSHASMEFLTQQLRRQFDHSDKDYCVVLTEVERTWLAKGSAKVCLRVNSEQELLEHYNKARSNGLTSFLIQDSGRTEFHGTPTYTACAIGPDYSDKIDTITGDLVPY